MKFKKFISSILAVSMLASLMPMTVFAEEIEDITNVRPVYQDRYGTLSFYWDCPSEITNTTYDDYEYHMELLNDGDMIVERDATLGTSSNIGNMVVVSHEMWWDLCEGNDIKFDEFTLDLYDLESGELVASGSTDLDYTITLEYSNDPVTATYSGITEDDGDVYEVTWGDTSDEDVYSYNSLFYGAYNYPLNNFIYTDYDDETEEYRFYIEDNYNDMDDAEIAASDIVVENAEEYSYTHTFTVYDDFDVITEQGDIEYGSTDQVENFVLQIGMDNNQIYVERACLVYDILPAYEDLELEENVMVESEDGEYYIRSNWNVVTRYRKEYPETVEYTKAKVYLCDWDEDYDVMFDDDFPYMDIDLTVNQSTSEDTYTIYKVSDSEEESSDGEMYRVVKYEISGLPKNAGVEFYYKGFDYGSATIADTDSSGIYTYEVNFRWDDETDLLNESTEDYAVAITESDYTSNGGIITNIDLCEVYYGGDDTTSSALTLTEIDEMLYVTWDYWEEYEGSETFRFSLSDDYESRFSGSYGYGTNGRAIIYYQPNFASYFTEGLYVNELKVWAGSEEATMNVGIDVSETIAETQATIECTNTTENGDDIEVTYTVSGLKEGELAFLVSHDLGAATSSGVIVNSAGEASFTDSSSDGGESWRNRFGAGDFEDLYVTTLLTTAGRWYDCAFTTYTFPARAPQNLSLVDGRGNIDVSWDAYDDSRYTDVYVTTYNTAGAKIEDNLWTVSTGATSVPLYRADYDLANTTDFEIGKVEVYFGIPDTSTVTETATLDLTTPILVEFNEVVNAVTVTNAGADDEFVSFKLDGYDSNNKWLHDIGENYIYFVYHESLYGTDKDGDSEISSTLTSSEYLNLETADLSEYKLVAYNQTGLSNLEILIFSLADLPAQEIDWDETAIPLNTTYGTGVTGYTAINTSENGGAVTYSSSDETVATVDAETGEVTIVGAGDVTISATAEGTSEYKVTAVTYTISVAKKDASVTISDATKVFGDALPSFEYTDLTGVIGDDDLGITYDTTATASSNVGTYDVTAVATNENYTLTSNTATLTITKAAAPVVADINADLYYQVSADTEVTIVGMPADAGTVTVTEVNEITGEYTIISDTVVIDGDKITVTPTDTADLDDVVNISVAISSTNYEDTTAMVILTVVEEPEEDTGSSNNNSSGGSGGSSSDTTTTVTDGKTTVTTTTKTSNGTTTATVDTDDITSAIETLEASEETATTLEISVSTSSSTTAVQVNLDSTVLDAYTESSVEKLVITSDIGVMEISKEAAESISSQADGEAVTIIIDKVDTESTLNTRQIEVIGDAPVYDLSVKVGDKYITEFDGGSITISLPYELKDGEDAAGVTIWYLDEDGNIEKLTAMFDEDTGLVTFVTNHFSLYFIAYQVSLTWDNPFEDVAVSDWYYDYIYEIVQAGLMNGTSDDTFEPESTTTRAMIVTMLYRLADATPVDYLMTFEDIASGSYYEEAVRWAASNGIVSGYSDEEFAPEDSITREQLATILYNYANFTEMDVSVGEDTNILSYTDATAISDYAFSPLQWACGSGIIQGNTDSTLNPQGNATRAESATMLVRFLDAIN